jgi:hypothetical protein
MFNKAVHTVNTVEESKVQMLNTNEDSNIFSDSISQSCLLRHVKILVRHIHAGQ